MSGKCDVRSRKATSIPNSYLYSMTLKLNVTRDSSIFIKDCKLPISSYLGYDTSSHLSPRARMIDVINYDVSGTVRRCKVKWGNHGNELDFV